MGLHLVYSQNYQPVYSNSTFLTSYNKYFLFSPYFLRVFFRRYSELCHVLPSAWNNSAPTGRILIKFGISSLFENLQQKFQFHENVTRITSTLHDDVVTFMISRWIILRIRNISDKSCRENQTTNFMINTFLQKSCSLWDNVKKCCGARQATGDNIVTRMRIHTPTHTHTHTQKHTHTRASTHAHTHQKYVIHIAFSRQDYLRRRASILGYTYIVCLVLVLIDLITLTTFKREIRNS